MTPQFIEFNHVPNDPIVEFIGYLPASPVTLALAARLDLF